MPFDNTPAPTITETPDLATLAYVLRHRELWPEGFVWDYRECETCAMGMASGLWRIPIEVFENYTDSDEDTGAETVFAMPKDAADQIFWNLDWKLRRGMHNVTPEHVASAIEAYLASRSA